MAKVLVSLADSLLKRIGRAADASRRTKAIKRLDRLFADSPRGEPTEAIRAERDAR